MSLSRFHASFGAGAAGVALALLFPACQKSSPPGPPVSSDPRAALALRGRQVYQTNCTACHNADPHKPGSIGPDVAGSSRELLEARVTGASYPPGYSPKRSTHAMAALPHLKGEIEALAAYLNP